MAFVAQVPSLLPCKRETLNDIRIGLPAYSPIRVKLLLLPQAFQHNTCATEACLFIRVGLEDMRILNLTS